MQAFILTCDGSACGFLNRVDTTMMLGEAGFGHSMHKARALTHA